jgi:hypothetical protein
LRKYALSSPFYSPDHAQIPLHSPSGPPRHRSRCERTGQKSALGGPSIENYSQGGRGTLHIAFEFPELFHSASAGSAGLHHEKRIFENKGQESDQVGFAPGDGAWTLARSYARNKQGKFPLRLPLYTGNSQKDFNYEANLEEREFLKSIEIPHQTLLIPDVSHSTKQAYAKRAKKRPFMPTGESSPGPSWPRLGP